MADREARVTFRAETEQFQAQVRAANQAMSGLRSEMRLNDAQFSNTGDRADYLRSRSQILSSQLDSNRQKQEALRAELEVARRVYGEDSTEVANLERQLNYCAAQEQQLQSQLSATNSELAASQTATGQLTTTISEQERELGELKDAYVEAVLAKGEDSDEARELAEQIDELSGNLGENKRALEQAEQAADDLDQSMEEADESTEDLSGSFDALTVAAGNLVSEGLTRVVDAVVDVAKESFETGRTFEDSMAKVAALSGASAEELDMLTQTAQELGAATVYSSSEAADALGYMALAGWDAQQSADALGGVLNLAASSGMDLAQASDIVTDYMSAFGLECQQSGYFADILSYAQANANTTVEGLGAAFQNCAANMNAAGQDVETTTALLSMMANQGLKGSRAGTALSAVMRDMTAKMEDGAIAIGDTNVQVMDSEGNYRDLTDILLDVEAATDGMGDAEKATALASTFTADSIKGLNLMLNAGVSEAAFFEDELRSASVTGSGLSDSMAEAGMSLDEMRAAYGEAGISAEQFDEALRVSYGSAGDFVDILNEWAETDASSVMDDLGYSLDDLQGAMDASRGTAEEMAEVMTDNLGGDLMDLEGSIEVLQLSLYDKLEPAMRDAVTALSEVVDTVSGAIDTVWEFMGQHPELQAALVALGVALGVLVGYLAGQQLISGIKAVKTAFMGLSATLTANPIVLVVAAIAGLVAAFVYLWNTNEGFREAVTRIWEAIKGFVTGAIQTIGSVISTVLGTIRSVWTTVWGAVSSFVTGVWGTISGSVTTAINVISRVIAMVLAYIRAVWSSAWQIVSSVASNVWNGIRNTISTVINAISTVIRTVINAISAVWSAVWGTVSTVASNVWNGIRNTISTAINAAHTVISSVVNAISSTVSRVFNGIRSTVSSVWNGIRDAMTGPINTAKDTISGAIDRIKDIINGAHLQLPKFKLPHFRIDGGELPWGIGGKGRKPSIAIDWYARGGILTAPTIFGWDGGSFLGGGEAGPEAVLPIDALQGYIDAAFERNMGGGEILRVERAVDRLRMELPRTIAENAPDSYPGDRAFREAVRRVAA